MTLSRAPDWKFFITDLRQQVERQGSVTNTVLDIIAETEANDPAIHMRWFWLAHQSGGGDYDGFVDAGVSLVFFPDERSKTVASVTFSPAPRGEWGFCGLAGSDCTWRWTSRIRVFKRHTPLDIALLASAKSEGLLSMPAWTTGCEARIGPPGRYSVQATFAAIRYRTRRLYSRVSSPVS